VRRAIVHRKMKFLTGIKLFDSEEFCHWAISESQCLIDGLFTNKSGLAQYWWYLKERRNKIWFMCSLFWTQSPARWQFIKDSYYTHRAITHR